MIDKTVRSVADAMAGLQDGATVLIGGFGAVGQPLALIEGLVEAGVSDLTVVANNAGNGRVGLARLLALGRVRRIICSFPRSAGSVVFEELYRARKIELEIVPQGTLAERLRAAGAGVGAFFTPTGVGTILARGKQTQVIEGREMILEYALSGDVALIEAWQADRWGNLTYRSSGRNFNPVMCTAAACTIVQAQHIVELGVLGPEQIVTPSIFVNRVIHVPYGDPPIFDAVRSRGPMDKPNPMGWTRTEMAARLANDIPEGWNVNLGIGIPTMVAEYVPLEREVIFHSENGILGVGPSPPREQIDPWLVNAGKQYVSLRSGGAYFHHADSFAMVRGGHIDLCVLGAFQVAENGDIANWATSENDMAPAVGGAMDLAAGARRLWVIMEHTTRAGQPKVVRHCSYPLTAPAAVKRLYTNLAVLDVTPGGFEVIDMVDTISYADLQALTEADLSLPIRKGI